MLLHISRFYVITNVITNIIIVLKYWRHYGVFYYYSLLLLWQFCQLPALYWNLFSLLSILLISWFIFSLEFLTCLSLFSPVFPCTGVKTIFLSPFVFVGSFFSVLHRVCSLRCVQLFSGLFFMVPFSCSLLLYVVVCFFLFCLLFCEVSFSKLFTLIDTLSLTKK